MNHTLTLAGCASMLAPCFPAHGQQAGAAAAEANQQTVFVTANQRRLHILIETGQRNLSDASIGRRSARVEVELCGQNPGAARGPCYLGQAGLVAGPTPRTAALRVRCHF